MTRVRKTLGYISCIAVGAIAWWLVVSHIIHFHNTDHIDFNVDVYIGTNVVVGWADLTFFSYQTLLFFGTWNILFGLSSLCRWNKVRLFCCKSTVLSFFFANYCLTTVLYTVFELCSKPITFGLWDTSLSAIHNLGSNLIVHYVYFVFSLIAFLRVPASKGNVRLGLPLVALYASIYCVSVKLLGEFAYKIRWFPYVIFDLDSFAAMLNVGRGLAVFLLVLTYVVIFVGYCTVYLLFVRCKNRQSAHSAQ